MSDVKGEIVCDHRIGDPVEMLTLTTCPKCNTRGFYNTLVLASNGVQFVPPVTALMQALKKILTEARRPSGYGFDYRLLRGPITPSILSVTSAEVNRCMQYYIAIQQHEKARGVAFNPSEEISNIDSIDVSQSTTEPRRVVVSVTLSTVSGSSVNIITSQKA